MFDDSARTWVAVRCSVAWFSASWKARPPTTTALGTVKTLVGVMAPASRAAEKVTTLKTEPGS